MTAYALMGGDEKKFIPVLRRGDWSAAAPTWLLGRGKIDLSGDPYPEWEYEELLRTLHSVREPAPPIGPRPDFVDSRPTPVPVPPKPPPELRRLDRIIKVVFLLGLLGLVGSIVSQFPRDWPPNEYHTRWLRAVNNTGEPMEVWLRYEAEGRWYPSPPGPFGPYLAFWLAPGQATDLYDIPRGNRRIGASAMCIRGMGLRSRHVWQQDWLRVLPLVRGSYQANNRGCSIYAFNWDGSSQYQTQ